MKLFRRQKKIEEPDSYEYWKDPRLDDEGTYDYLIEELPSDTERWQWWYEKCGTCGKYHRFNKVNTHYFYTYDGWDSISYTECWKCRVKDKICVIKCRIKRKIKQKKEYRKWIKLWEQKGVRITKELKETTRKMCQ